MNSKNKKFTQFLDDKLIPLGSKIGEQRHLKAIRDGMVAATPLALLGGLTLIVTSPPVDLDMIEPTNLLYKFLILWKEWAIQYGLQIELLQRVSMGLMALFITMIVAHSLAKTYNINPENNMIISAVSFLISTAPSRLGVMVDTISDGMSAGQIIDNQQMVMAINYLGAEGIFTAIVIAIIVTETSRLLYKKNLLIQMPDSVPAPVQASFASIIPLIVNALFAFLISWTIQSATGGLLIPDLIQKLFSPLLNIVDSPIGIILISILTQLLWLVGLHGSSIISGVVGAFELGNLAANADAIAAGNMVEFIYTEPFRAFFMILGGAGATIGLNILMLRSKSKQLKTLGRLAIVPSIFNINEPIIFGTPLVLNPVLAVPFILVQVINGILSYLMMSFGIISKTFSYVPWTTPGPIGAMLSTLDYKAFFWALLLIVLDTVIWYPFFKSYEKQLIQEENAA